MRRALCALAEVSYIDLGWDGLGWDRVGWDVSLLGWTLADGNRE